MLTYSPKNPKSTELPGLALPNLTNESLILTVAVCRVVAVPLMNKLPETVKLLLIVTSLGKLKVIPPVLADAVI